MTYDEWFSEFQSLGLQDGWVVQSGPAWRESFDDGLSAQEALDEEYASARDML